MPCCAAARPQLPSCGRGCRRLFSGGGGAGGGGSCSCSSSCCRGCGCSGCSRGRGSRGSRGCGCRSSCCSCAPRPQARRPPPDCPPCPPQAAPGPGSTHSSSCSSSSSHLALLPHPSPPGAAAGCLWRCAQGPGSAAGQLPAPAPVAALHQPALDAAGGVCAEGSVGGGQAGAAGCRAEGHHCSWGWLPLLWLAGGQQWQQQQQ